MIQLFNPDLAASKFNVSLDEARNARRAGWLVDVAARRRPRYFDGRFLTARDLIQDQNYFLARQAEFARLSGGGVVAGLEVFRPELNPGQDPVVLSQTAFTVACGHGVTPAGDLVVLREDVSVDINDVATVQRLDAVFGLEVKPNAPVRNRSGLFIIGLRYVEYSANPVAPYPSDLQAPRKLEDGEIIEATAITLIPVESLAASDLGQAGRARLVREIFTERTRFDLPRNVLPVGVVSISTGSIQWVDSYLVRRDASADVTLLRGHRPRRQSEALIRQYEAQISELLAERAALSPPPSPPLAPLAAEEHFRLLPPCGTLPRDSVRFEDSQGGSPTPNDTHIVQYFFPAEVQVELLLVSRDELSGLIEEAMHLPPVDLESSASEREALAVSILIGVPRHDTTASASGFADFVGRLDGDLTRVPKARAARRGARKPLIDVLQRERRRALSPAPTGSVSEELLPWQDALALVAARNEQLFYVRRRRLSQVAFANPRFQAFPPDSPDPSETLDAEVRRRLFEAGELAPIQAGTTSPFNFIMRKTTQDVLERTQALLGRSGMGELVLVNAVVAELAYLTRVRLEELVVSQQARDSIVDLGGAIVTTPGAAPVRVRASRLQDVVRTEQRYSRSTLGDGWRALVALASALDDEAERKMIASALRVAELDALALALADAERQELANELLALARAGDITGIRDLTDVRYGPLVAAPDEDDFPPIPGDPGSAIATMLGEGRLYRLIHDTSTTDAFRVRLSAIVNTQNLNQVPIISGFLSEVVAEGWGLNVNGPAVDTVLTALNNWDVGESLDLGSLGGTVDLDSDSGIVGGSGLFVRFEALNVTFSNVAQLTSLLAAAQNPLVQEDYRVIGLYRRIDEFIRLVLTATPATLQTQLVNLKSAIAARSGSQVASILR